MSSSVTTIRIISFASAAVPAAAAGVVPTWFAITAAQEISSAVRDPNYIAPIIWALALAIPISLTCLKFLMPWQARQHQEAGRVGLPIAIGIVWIFSIIMSSLVVARAGLQLIPADMQLKTGAIVFGGIAWLCVEIVGTLALPALTYRSPLAHAAGSSAFDQSAPTAKQPIGAAQPPALSAEDLYVWLSALLTMPQDKLPAGVEVPHGSSAIVTSHRKLAQATRQPRNNVVRRLKQLEYDGRLEVVASHRETVIVFPRPDPN